MSHYSGMAASVSGAKSSQIKHLAELPVSRRHCFVATFFSERAILAAWRRAVNPQNEVVTFSLLQHDLAFQRFSEDGRFGLVTNYRLSAKTGQIAR